MPGHILLERVLNLLGRNRDLVHADLVAVIQRRRSSQRQQQHRRDPRLRRPDPARDARTVVIAQHPVGPCASRKCRFILRDDFFDRARIPGGGEQREIEWQMRARKLLAVIGDQPLERQIDLADQNPIVEFIDDAAHFRDHVLHLRLIRGVARQQAFVRRPAGAKTRIGRVVAKLLVLDQVPDHIDAKTVDALAEPEAHDIVDRRAHFAGYAS